MLHDAILYYTIVYKHNNTYHYYIIFRAGALRGRRLERRGLELNLLYYIILYYNVLHLFHNSIQ